MNKIDLIIKKLELIPHPEGGFFKENYRSSGYIPKEALSEVYSGNRNHSTSIYFLLRSRDFSAFHKINQDEIWHHYDGSALTLHMIDPQGHYSNHIIGKNIDLGESPQFIVPAQHWFAASVINDDDFSLVGCTVAPGFDFDDFVLPSRQSLIDQFPQHEKIITELTN